MQTVVTICSRKEGLIGFRLSEVDEALKLNGVVIERHEQLIFVGNCIKVKKDSLTAFYHRQAAGNSCFHKWWPVLRSKMRPLKRRVQILFAGPFLAATWHSETWTMSPEIAKHLTSWVRNKLGQMVGIHLKTDSELGINTWWKTPTELVQLPCVCAIATL